MEQLLELLKNIDNIYSNINTIEDLNKLKVEYIGHYQMMRKKSLVKR